MTVTDTVLVFVGIPLGVIVLVFLAVYGKTMVRQPNRYRPGRSWDYPSAWYVPHPDAIVASESTGQTTAVGGANGEW